MAGAVLMAMSPVPWLPLAGAGGAQRQAGALGRRSDGRERERIESARTWDQDRGLELTVALAGAEADAVVRAARMARAAAEPDPAMREASMVLASLPYDAAGDGWALRIGDHPEAPGHWGVTDPYRRELFIGEAAFATEERLFMVVAHEAAHARHFSHPELAEVITTMPGGREAYADCQSIVWGASDAVTHYWSCPEPYRARVAALN